MRQKHTADLEPIDLVQILVSPDRSKLQDLIKCRIDPGCLCIVENECHLDPRISSAREVEDFEHLRDL